MYLLSSVYDTLRVPPSMFDEDLSEILLELAQESLEDKIFPELGQIVAVLEAEEVGIGRIIAGDGAAYYDCKFKVLSYLPEQHEVVEGPITDITEFGCFVRIGVIDALCHVSQITDDFFSYNPKAKTLIGRETGKKLQVDDVIRGRIIAFGVGKTQIRVGVTMRQPGLGKLEWVEEWKEQMLAKRAEV